MNIKLIGTLMIALVVAACVTSKEAQERMDQAEQIHEHAPAWFVDTWESYLEASRGRYSILAVDRKSLAAAMSYCTSGCQELFGNQNRTLKSLWATQTVLDCRENARKWSPTEVPACSVYAIKDEIIWRTFPWKIDHAETQQFTASPPRFEPDALAPDARDIVFTWEGYPGVHSGTVNLEQDMR